MMLQRREILVLVEEKAFTVVVDSLNKSFFYLVSLSGVMSVGKVKKLCRQPLLSSSVWEGMRGREEKTVNFSLMNSGKFLSFFVVWKGKRRTQVLSPSPHFFSAELSMES